MGRDEWPLCIAMSEPSAPRVLFLSNVAWDFVWQRHQTLAALWGRRARVDYVEIPGVRRPGWRDAGRIAARFGQLLQARPRATTPAAEGVELLRPWLLPAATAALCSFNARLIDRAFARRPALRGPYDVAMVYSPARSALQWLDRAACRRIVFDCTDDLPAVKGVPPFFAEDEATLLARADLTLVPSRVLFERKRRQARRIARLPHGAWIERFLPEPGSPDPRGRPLTVLYYGHLHRQHLDFAALDRLAGDRPGWRVVLAGPERSAHRWPSNVERPGHVPHERLRELVRQADALLLPYSLNRYTEAVMPAKTYECLATGLPVVATPLPELAADFAGEMRFVPPGEEWAPAVEAALREDTPAARARRIALARENTWERRFEEMLGLLRETEEKGAA